MTDLFCDPHAHDALIVLVSGAVTLALRFLPFLTFGRRTPAIVAYLGRVLPGAIMPMLAVYCLRNVNLTAAPYGAPEFLACAVAALLHVRLRSLLLSVLCGTACYMFLVQTAF